MVGSRKRRIKTEQPREREVNMSANGISRAKALNGMNPMKSTTRVTTLEKGEMDSPIGTIVIVTNGSRVCALNFSDRWAPAEKALRNRFGALEFRNGSRAQTIIDKVRRYFEGDLEFLAGIEVDTGGTPFQQRVWTALRDIPSGSTRSYGELAKAIGSQSAVRAVGAANGANPISIIIPCHRVIGADGSLTGYGGGINRKRWLLDHESRTLFR